MNDSTSSCKELEEQVSLLAAGCLSPEESQEVGVHLDECESCKQRFLELSAICGGLAGAKPSIAPETLERIEQSFVQDQRSLPTSKTQSWSLAKVAALAACLLLILSSFYVFAHWESSKSSDDQLVENIPELPHQGAEETPKDSIPSLLAMRLAAIESEEGLESLLDAYSGPRYQPLNTHYAFEELTL